jgi:hypothetical protein
MNLSRDSSGDENRIAAAAAAAADFSGDGVDGLDPRLDVDDLTVSPCPTNSSASE